MNVSIAERGAVENLMAGGRFKPCLECGGQRHSWRLFRPGHAELRFPRRIRWNCIRCGNEWAEPLLAYSSGPPTRDTASEGSVIQGFDTPVSPSRV